MEKNIVESTERLVKEGIVIDVNGQHFSAADLRPVCDERKIAPLQLSTLTGLMSYIKNQIDNDVVIPEVIVVNSFNGVSLYEKLDVDTKIRQKAVEVFLDPSIKRFQFDTFMGCESFIIGLQSMFEDNVDRSRLLQYVSRLTINDNIEIKDDGITQEAVLKKGLSGALKEKSAAPSIITLAPFRTFSEISQPKSDFLFRMRTTDGLPQCGLFESDGGAWKAEAMKRIAEFLKASEVKVIY